MKITFYGAASEVTGSCYYIQSEKANIIVDCGMFQGKEQENHNQELLFDPKEVDIVFLTHAHIDHEGRLPMLVKKGFHKSIIAVEQSAKLIQLMLEDSAKIQEQKEKEADKNSERYEALYSKDDVDATMKLMGYASYEKEILSNLGIEYLYRDAGHLLGSSSLMLTIEGKEFVFSGDIGNYDQPFIKDPIPFRTADYLFCESTYGDRNHKVYKDIAKDLAKVVNETFKRQGTVIIPSFAVGRTQNLLYYFREMKERKLIPYDFLVFVDSPMAIRASEIYIESMYRIADEETTKLLDKGISPITFTGLELVGSASESRNIDHNPNHKVIIASSGMCEAGRIQHHLKHHLPRKEDSVIFVGYQAEDTLGRKIVEGENKVDILGSTIKVKAHIIDYRGLSGHADQRGLLEWIHTIEEKPKIIFITHGELEAAMKMKELLDCEGYTTKIPKLFDIVET